MKLCKDCKHFGKETHRFQGPSCRHHPCVNLDLVTGKDTIFYLSCNHYRRDFIYLTNIPCSDKCGTVARHFEPKPPSLFRRVLNKIMPPF